MKEKYIYPCVIYEEDGIYYANFKDFDACFTDGDSIEDIRSAIDKLSKASESFATRIYQAASQQANAGNSENKNDSDDNIVEAEEVK